MERRFPAEAASIPIARRAVIDAISAAGLTDRELHRRVALAVSEASTNAVRHAYPTAAAGHYDVTVDRTADNLVVTITDHGTGLDRADTRTSRPDTHTRTGGLGLAIMNAQADNLRVESNSTGTIVTLRFNADG